MNCGCELWLYGSHARGDADPTSDYDVLAIGDFLPTLGEVLAHLEARPANLAISSYTWPEIEAMATYGSLFLHHLRLEGSCLLRGNRPRGLREILDSLPAYKRAGRDVVAFVLALQDVRDSILSGGSLEFELSVLGTILRHASVLGCYICGHPNFGRTAPVENVVKILRLDPALAADYPALYAYRRWADGRVTTLKPISAEKAMEWCDRIAVLLQMVKEYADEYARELSPSVASR